MFYLSELEAARGELYRELPAGLVWSEEDGEVGLHPEAAVTSRLSVRSSSALPSSARHAAYGPLSSRVPWTPFRARWVTRTNRAMQVPSQGRVTSLSKRPAPTKTISRPESPRLKDICALANGSRPAEDSFRQDHAPESSASPLMNG